MVIFIMHGSLCAWECVCVSVCASVGEFQQSFAIKTHREELPKVLWRMVMTSSTRHAGFLNQCQHAIGYVKKNALYMGLKFER